MLHFQETDDLGNDVLPYALSLTLLEITVYKCNCFRFWCNRNSKKVLFSIHPVSKDSVLCLVMQVRQGARIWLHSELPHSLPWTCQKPPQPLFPIFRDTSPNLPEYHHYLEKFRCRTLASGKACKNGPVTWEKPSFKGQLHAFSISLPMCTHPHMLRSSRDRLLLLPGPAEGDCLLVQPSGNIPVLFCSGHLPEAREGFPMPDCQSDCDMEEG